MTNGKVKMGLGLQLWSIKVLIIRKGGFNFVINPMAKVDLIFKW